MLFSGWNFLAKVLSVFVLFNVIEPAISIAQEKARWKRYASLMRPTTSAFFIYSSPKIAASTRRRDWTPS